LSGGYVGIEQAAIRVNRSARTIRNWISDGLAVNLGWIKVEDLLEYDRLMRSRRGRPKAPVTVVPELVSSVLAQLAREVGEVNVANGWDTSRTMVAHPTDYDSRWVTAHKIAELGLITTEVAEAIEEVRSGHPMNQTYYHAINQPDTVKATKPEGVPSELADVVIRVLDIADAYSIDLGAAIIEKLAHNRLRGLHHGGKAL
jgi:NTP pyrophosphatase (non-canonical NTP hydrolase)